MAFNDILISKIDGGLFTRTIPEKIPVNYSPDLQNIDFESGGSVRNRLGNALFGVGVSSLSGVRTLHNFKRQDGIEIPMRSWSTFVEYYNRQTSAWSQLSGGFTTNLIFGYTDYVDHTYLCNAVDAMFRWNGQYSVVTDIHASSATVIEVPSLTNWLSAGEAIIGTMPVYYGSRTSGTLSAMTGISAAIGASEEIAQAPTSSRGWGAAVSSTPRGNILITNGDRIFVAGCSAEGTRLYYSGISAVPISGATNFTYSNTHVDNEGGFVTLADGGAYITALANRGVGKILGFKKDAIKSFEFKQIQTNQIDWPTTSDVAQARNCGALASKSAVGVESDVWYVSPGGEVRSVADIANQGLSLKDNAMLIAPTMADLSFVSASGIYHNKKYYLACKESAAVKNNRVMVNDLLANDGKGAWSEYVGWNVNDWMDFDGDLYYADSLSHSVYKVGVNYDDGGYGYESYYKTPLINHDKPHERKRLRYVYLEGYATLGCVLSATCFYDALSAGKIEKIIYGNEVYVDPTTSITFGDTVFSQGTFGGDPSGSSFVLNKFRVRLSYNLRNLFNYQLEVKSNIAGQAWRIDQIASYVEKESEDVFPILNYV